MSDDFKGGMPPVYWFVGGFVAGVLVLATLLALIEAVLEVHGG